MCEIFGLSSLNDVALNGYLRTFYSHSKNHPHGWGLACISRDGALIEKESIRASDSNYLKERLSQPVMEKILLAHIRYATIGNVEYKNCHPFTSRDNTGRRWTLVHNGTIFDFPPLNPYVKKQTGDTDSERVFLYFMDKLNEAQSKKGARLAFEERFELFDKIVCEMSRDNKLNLLFSDGKYLYAHTNCRGTLYYLIKDNAVLIATAPLSEEEWQPMPFTRLLAYYKGKLIKTGTNHENEYFESEESMKMLYRIFANL